MAKVIILEKLEEEINKKFKKESIEVIKLLYSLENNPNKGKLLGNVGGIAIKELKYKSFRFYFILDGFKVRVTNIEYLNDLLIKFIRMSNKKYQQQTIDEIKQILRITGPRGFE